MYLKRLELQGFKSFAPRTMLEFSPGITAIVGPNGSGKSNIADAIRWVLGEQSMRQLRGKKSDDVIFAGGQGRAQMQMAEVSLVLDNSASWLPSEHTEVTGTRRSFRSGESEYLINGQRVRLRDLLLLLAQARIGHDSYTVIGQGLVDQALSLRADERRGLFEDAAGIRQFQAQRTDAEQKLTLTQSNLSRLRDILGESEPRLGPLAEQAKRARDYSGVRDELKRLLRTWFAWQWEDALSKRTHADAAEAAVAGRIQGVRERLTDLEAEGQRTREARDGLRERLAELRRARGEVTGRVQALEQDFAVGQERIASLLRQASDIESEQGEQGAALAAAEAHASALDEQLTLTEREIAVVEAQLDALERSQHVAGQEQERAEAALRAAQRDVIQLQARLGAAQTESGRLQRQLGERNRALATRVEAVNASQRKLEAAQTSLRKRTTACEAARREVEGLVGQREAVQRELAEGQSEIDEIRMAVADAERERRAIGDRLALLEEWRRGQDGYADGARALLQARAEDRPPALGALAQLIQVTPGYEVAVEAALGPLLTAVVAVSATDALACARWLRERGAGYAQIVWPEDGGGGGRSTPDAEALAIRPDDHEELVPIARYLEIGAELQPMLDDLVKGLYLVPELDTAHRLMSDLAAPRQLGARRDHPAQPLRALITVGGEVLHVHQWLRGGAASATSPSGAHREGSRSAAPTTLARERELRQLPAELERCASEIADREARLAHAAQSQQQRTQHASALAQELQRAEGRAQELARQVAGLQREEERAQSEAQLSQAVAEQLGAEAAGLEQEVAATAAHVAEQETEQRAAAEHLAAAQDMLDEIASRTRAQEAELARQRTAIAVQRQDAKAVAQRAEHLRAQAHELATNLERRAERVQSIASQRAVLEELALQQRAALAELRGRLRELSSEVQTHEAQVAAAEQTLVEMDRRQAAARQELAGAEVEYRGVIIEAQRARDAVETLGVQMREELVEVGEVNASDGQIPVSDLARLLGLENPEETPEEHAPHAASDNGRRSSAEDATKMRRQIDHLRARLRHLGGYDPDAPQVYEELKTRHDFLTGQVRDMEQAATNLRTIIAELDTTMRRQFAETFQAVNLRFQRHFTTLFSGGAARLELTAPRKQSPDDADEDDELAQPQGKSAGLGGVEVYVQIPGKRVQDLSLLSGGERAMVSAALLFALLETNPPPFCLLDEVDAALDETNVVRFCAILKTLAEETQFVVITHNKVTMTHAGAIYGISMGPDSISKVLSMRLAEAQAAH